MINRLQLLRNIGQFDSVDTAANIPFARLTVIYSENGRGKTTLAAILRSLATGDPTPIAERKRLSSQNPPHVVIDCSGGPPLAMFQDNAWNRTVPELMVFDDVFINENVHSGLAVDAHHRQNLHEFILGAQAAEISRRLQTLIERIEAHNATLRVKAAGISAALRGPFSVDEFCALAPRADIEEAIQGAERDLAAAREQDAILATPPFENLSLPAFDAGDFERILGQDLPGLEASALQRVLEHLSGLGDGGEEWVADGVRRMPQVNGELATRCPFCGQAIQNSPLIQHYQAYFSAAYAELRNTVSDAIETVNRIHGGDASAGFERDVRVVIERRQFWARFCEVPEITLDTAAIVRDWRAAREGVIAQLATKRGAPLEPLTASPETLALIASYEVHRELINGLHGNLQTANDAIAIAKERAATANLALLDSDLARLKAMKARHTPEMAALCGDYLIERTAKEATEQQRDQARTELERHRATAFPGYQTAINLYLGKFNAGFRLDSVAYANTRGGPTCTYDVIINERPVAIGQRDAGPGEPSFRNTLSAGDRNTLALAFFFASLDQDPGQANKLVVIDDPVSSLDEHRTLTTVQEIRLLANRVAQVVVLSHSKPFLCRLWEGTDTTMRAALQVLRDPPGSTLLIWNVDEDAYSEHDRRHARLRDYLDNGQGNNREVAQSIRPHLEAFLRVACPDSFPPGTLLGPFTNVCQQRLGTARQILSQAAIQELQAIVEYGNRFHHDTNPAWETEAVNDGELRSFVDRAMLFSRK